MRNGALVFACLAYLGRHGQPVRASRCTVQSMRAAEMHVLLQAINPGQSNPRFQAYERQERIRRRGALKPLRSLAKLVLALAPPAAFSSIISASSRPRTLEKRTRLGHQIRVMSRRGRLVPEMAVSEEVGFKVMPEKKTVGGSAGLFCTACTKAAAMSSTQQSKQIEPLAGNILIPPYVQLCPGHENVWLKENKLTPLGSLFRHVAPEEQEEPVLPEVEEAQALQLMNPREFTVKTFNVLASQYHNRNPWMLQGADVTKAQRDAIWKKYESGDRTCHGI